jgi:hypothetical protein
MVNLRITQVVGHDLDGICGVPIFIKKDMVMGGSASALENITKSVT